MTVEISENTYYLRYCEKRLTLPLYYCHNPYIVPFDGGYYRCEEVDEKNMKVYDDAKGKIVYKRIFDAAFKKPTKFQLFLHKHFWWL